MPGKMHTTKINHVTTMGQTVKAPRMFSGKNGFEIQGEGIRFDGQAFLFIADPDGTWVEFCTAAGYAPAPTCP